MKRYSIYLVFGLFLYINVPAHAEMEQNYTVLNATYYKNIFLNAREKIKSTLNRLNSKQFANRNSEVMYLAEQLNGIPYDQFDAIGEGDWQPGSLIYRGGARHINQMPVYRLDKLNCQSYTQLVLALLHSHNIDEFDACILKASYGAAKNPAGEIVHYYNRNHFVDGDFNPVNQHNGFLSDVTAKGNLAFYAQTLTLNLTRQAWFNKQRHALVNTVWVLHALDGEAMVKHFLTDYAELPFTNFKNQHIDIAYIPKQSIALLQHDGSYKPNEDLLSAIPAPAIAEIISDPKQWYVKHTLVRNAIGTELSVAHFGLLYRKKFHYGEIMYHQINCIYGDHGAKNCNVLPITCQKKTCNELMFSHATKSHPHNFYWYKQTNGKYACTKHQPHTHNVTYCNRVESKPLFAYLTEKQMDSYWYMENPAILGVHIEKIL